MKKKFKLTAKENVRVVKREQIGDYYLEKED